MNNGLGVLENGVYPPQMDTLIGNDDQSTDFGALCLDKPAHQTKAEFYVGVISHKKNPKVYGLIIYWDILSNI